jgi:hypothetical protein
MNNINIRQAITTASSGPVGGVILIMTKKKTIEKSAAKMIRLFISAPAAGRIARSSIQFPFPEFYARAAAVLCKELDTGGFQRALHGSNCVRSRTLQLRSKPVTVETPTPAASASVFRVQSSNALAARHCAGVISACLSLSRSFTLLAAFQ